MMCLRSSRRGSWIAPAFGCVLLMCVSVVVPATPAVGASQIAGGGSSFSSLIIDQWRADTAKAPYNLKLDYVAQGSSWGRSQFMSGNIDYGGSDIQFIKEEKPALQSGRCGGKPLDQCFAYVPVTAGGLAFMYNLVDPSGARINDLKLTRQVACKIFTGAITKWNAPEIVAVNPRLAGFNQDIIPVVRADGAGESYVLSEFCISAASAVWSAFRTAMSSESVGEDFKAGEPVSSWPVRQSGAGNMRSAPGGDGVTNLVADPQGGKFTITYTAAGYAKVRNFPTASLENAAGKFTQPDEENVTVALGYAQGNGDGTFKLDFTGQDPRAYFPSTYSYIVAPTGGFDAGKGATLAQFLCYAVSKGQVDAPSLRYARLSTVLVDLAVSQIVKIPGAPTAAKCPVAGAPPPPPPVVVSGGGGSAAPGTKATPTTSKAAAPGAKAANPGAAGASGSTVAGSKANGAKAGTAGNAATGSTGDAATAAEALADGSAVDGQDPGAGDDGTGDGSAATAGGVSAEEDALLTELASAKTAPPKSDGGGNGIWVFLQGIAAAAVVAMLLTMRRQAQA